MNIILFGFKNCGKTTIGKLLAKEFGKVFLDSDAFIENAYKKNTEKIYWSTKFMKLLAKKNLGC